MRSTEHQMLGKSTRWVFLTLTATLLTVSPMAAQKKKPAPPTAPQISPELDVERNRFLEGLRSAKPMPMPQKRTVQGQDTTASGDLVERDLLTGAVRVLPSHVEIRLPGQTDGGTPGLVSPQAAAAPRGQGDGVQEQKAASVEGKTPSGANQPSTQSATPPGPLLYPYTYPYNTVYKLLMRFGSNYYVCSGASASSFHLISAGHCIYNASEGGWASEVWAWAAQTDVVDPRYVEDYPYGVAKVVLNTTYNAWINSQDLNWDFSFLTLDRRMGDHTGWMGRETSCSSALNFTGYPIEYPYISFADSFYQFPGFDSGNVAYCNSNRIGLYAYIYGGHSGGPEWRFDGTNRWIEGVNSTSNRVGNAEGTRYTSNVHNDLNNTIANDQVVRPPVPRPDLIEYVFNGTSKGLLNTSATIGSTFGVKYNVFNAGFADSGDVSVSFYLTRNSNFSTYDYYVATQSDPSLGAYTYEVSSRYLTVPPSVPPGNYYLGYVMGSAVAQASYDNDKVIITNQLLSVSCPADGWESDNSSASASLLTPGIAQNHAICPSTDQDWARFTLAQTAAVNLSTDGPSGDTVMYLYDASLNQIAVDDDSGNGYFSLISRACATNPLSAGTYYVKVVGYGGVNSVPSYSLNLSTSTCPTPALASVSVPASITGGPTVTGRVTLAAAAGPGGVTVTLADNSGVTGTPGSVFVPAAATFADFPITSVPVAAATTVTFSATLSGVTKTDSMIVKPPVISSVAIVPSAVYGGTGATGTVTLNGAAPAGGMVVALADNSAATSIPGTVSVAAGSTTGTFAVGTIPVTADTTVTFTATLNAVVRTDTLLVRTPVLTGLTVAPTSVIGGTPSTGTVTISSPAPVGGTAVTLSSTVPTAAKGPSSVTVPAGATTVNFAVTSKPVLATVTVTLSGTRGAVTKTAGLKVNAPAVASIVLAPTSVKGGTPSTATVTLTGPAPSGFVLTLSSSNTAAATVPATTAVSANATTKSFTVTTLPVLANTSSSIRATYGTGYKAATLTVTK